MAPTALQVPDYHIHTSLCGHASGEMEEYVREAGRVGLSEIGFSDHMPLLHTREPSLTMAIGELAGYVESVLHLKGSCKGPEIKLGLEADYIPGQERQVEELLSRYPFDYVYGSVHYLGQWLVDHPAHTAEFDRRGIRKTYEDYFARVTGAARCGLFDCIGHLDVVKKFGHRLDEGLLEIVGPALGAIRDAGICIEVSPAGFPLYL